MLAFVLLPLSWNLIGVHAFIITAGSHNMKDLEGVWDLVGRAERLGYHASEHTVRTEDGYVLQVIRVHGKGVKRPPVLLMHGLQLSAAEWLDAGSASLAGLLAEEGLDLWLSNARGSYLSRRHMWLDPDTDPLYWKFSADEIGRLDVPAIIDYIQDTTGSDKIDYIGHSQGGAIFFIMCSERPEYCSKVNVMIGLAPASRMIHTTSLPFRLVTEYFQYTEETLHNLGIWEALPYGGALQSFWINFCELSLAKTKVCQVMLDFFFGPNPGSSTLSVLRRAISTTTAGTSVHNMAWFGQLVNSDEFRKFNYGPEKNLVHYGSETAPLYNISSITVPIVLIYGKNDAVVDVRDIEWLIGKLPNVRKVYEMEDPLWNHADFVLSKDIPKLLYPKIKETLG